MDTTKSIVEVIRSNILIIPKETTKISVNQCIGWRKQAEKIEFNCPMLSVIDFSAFAYFSKIKVINLENCTNLVEIGCAAFKQCGSLKSVSFPKNIIKIGSDAFRYCTILSVVSFPDKCSLYSIGEMAFAETSVKKFLIPEKVMVIKMGAFYKCKDMILSSLSNVFNVQDGVLYTNQFSILYQYPINKINVSFSLPSSTKQINSYAFSYSQAKEVVFNRELKYIGNSAFLHSLIERLVFIFNTEIHIIGNNTFESNKNIIIADLRNLTSLRSLSNKCFYDCTRLKSIFFPKSLTFLNGHCFKNCVSLSHVHIEENCLLESINFMCFMNTKIEHFYFPPGLKYLEPFCFASTSISSITVSPLNNFFFFLNDTLYSRNFDSIVFYCSILPNTVYTIHNKVIQLRFSCFYGSKNISRFVFNEELTTIMSNAISETGITSLILPHSLKTLGDSCFALNHCLEMIEFSSNCKIIPKYCLEGCNKLVCVNMVNVMFVRMGAFKDCHKISCINANHKLWGQIKKMLPPRVIESMKCSYPRDIFVII